MNGQLLFCYITKFNVISVGNYMNGFILNNMQLNLNQILHREMNNIFTNGVIHIFFHNYGEPLQKMTNGNHFAYLEPDPGCNLSLDRNTIQEINNDDLWIRNENVEIYKCYIIAKKKN